MSPQKRITLGEYKYGNSQIECDPSTPTRGKVRALLCFEMPRSSIETPTVYPLSFTCCKAADEYRPLGYEKAVTGLPITFSSTCLAVSISCVIFALDIPVKT